MAKIAVESIWLELEPVGQWGWEEKERTLEIEVAGGDLPMRAEGKTALLPRDLIAAIKGGASGKGYRHIAAPTTTAGSVGSVHASCDPATAESKITCNGEELATSEATGRFTITAGKPSRQPVPGGEIPDPVLVHSGVWRVKEQNAEQERLSEGEKTGAASQVLSTATQGRDRGGDAAASAAGSDDPATAVQVVPLEIGLRLAGDDALVEMWGHRALEGDGDLALEVRLAQPQGEGGVVGHFFWTFTWQELLGKEPGSKRLTTKALRIPLDAGVLERDRPIWIRILGEGAGREGAIEQISNWRGELVCFSRGRILRGDAAPHRAVRVRDARRPRRRLAQCSRGAGRGVTARELLRSSPRRVTAEGGGISTPSRSTSPSPGASSTDRSTSASSGSRRRRSASVTMNRSR